MKYKLLALLVLIFFIPVSSPPALAESHDNPIVIGVVTGQNSFNRTEINLMVDTEYTIIFENTDPTGFHNLRIDVDNDLEETEDVGDPDDLLIGVENNADGAVGPKSWTGTFFPVTAGNFTFYCGFAGHYDQGMMGTFTIESPDDQNSDDTSDTEGDLSSPSTYLFTLLVLINGVIITRFRN